MNRKTSIVVALLSIFSVLILQPISAQILYKLTIKDKEDTDIIAPFNSSKNDLIIKIYERINTAGYLRTTSQQDLKIPLGKTSLQKFQKMLRTKGISPRYYEKTASPELGKNFNQPIDISSIGTKKGNYTVTLMKPGYSRERIIFTIYQPSVDPNLFFTTSSITIKYKKNIEFLVDTGDSNLDQRITNGLNQKNKKLVRAKEWNFNSTGSPPPQQMAQQEKYPNLDFTISIK